MASGGTSSDPASARRPFVLAPFRGLRFDEAQVGDLGTVISPPYDVLDADIVRDLEAANRRNVVRLILSRRFERPYLAVRERLRKWREKGYLRADADAGLYLYQYTADGVTVRGLVGAVALREEAERVILPHENVMPGPVEDRTVLMRTTETNLEPILLVHAGSQRLRDLLSEVVRSPATARFQAVDGSRHELWQLSEPTALRMVAEELDSTSALIADGHHRYAAYLALQRDLRDAATADGTSPWDYGLALLVDQDDYPLRVGPIHRSVAALTMSDIADLAADRGDELVSWPDREAAFADFGRRASDPAQAASASFVVSDGRQWAVLSTPRSAPVDAAVLHHDLFEAWQVMEEQLGYHHSLDQALHTSARQPGVVIAVQPPTLAQVMEAAQRGIRMPRKTTSFWPKPRMGVVMRDLRDR
ncbi:MAG: Related to HTH domain of SpoOJ/ParA/ParB/repB family, involved in chromosome partitioning [uncultured Nocardioidaceae bacterium]|uniref:Related to HTH domain of SpoOJ/ParA/ParB/repB family, involved in chromosome partitioning n=1 Tax=uncultured Nocardioidaceae bacterium TaxID=253824 RepID=A0A6J4M9V0_9ACTN|nr:MAG: Related to HTH domain of SpoOJ/ParA/ParB/repB family, involved in chromosome partitioning [uncultured Nocardioidaceae bacterium]